MSCSECHLGGWEEGRKVYCATARQKRCARASYIEAVATGAVQLTEESVLQALQPYSTIAFCFWSYRALDAIGESAPPPTASASRCPQTSPHPFEPRATSTLPHSFGYRASSSRRNDFIALSLMPNILAKTALIVGFAPLQFVEWQSSAIII